MHQTHFYLRNSFIIFLKLVLLFFTCIFQIQYYQNNSQAKTQRKSDISVLNDQNTCSPNNHERCSQNSYLFPSTYIHFASIFHIVHMNRQRYENTLTSWAFPSQNNNLNCMTAPCPMTISSIILSETPMPFLSPIPLQITFCCTPLPHPLEWKVIYIGSASDEQFDQILEEFQIGPITEGGEMKFQLECQPPDATRLPLREIIAVTALVLTVSYKGQEFIRVGYYVHNVLDQEKMREQMNKEVGDGSPKTLIPSKQQISFGAIFKKNASIVNNANQNQANNQQKIALPMLNSKNIGSFLPHINRIILSSKPRITRFVIDWSPDESKQAQIPEQSNLSGPEKISTEQQIDGVMAE